ncbi:MAG: hypothetical protein HY647_03945 [Acidobacteria bacterium]|nr:hypothetical protein [Acidobacteriota bacterium]
MSAVLSFADLLRNAGAEPPRWGRGKWRCWRCEGKTPALSVDLGREVFYCFRCGWRGGRRALEQELGIEGHKPTSEEIRRRRIVRPEAEKFSRWLRAERLRSARLLRDIGAAELQLRREGRAALGAGRPIAEKVWALLQFAAAIEEMEGRTYERLCDVDAHGATLYQMFTSERRAAA